MIGLIFFAVLGMWFFVVLKITRFLMRRIKNDKAGMLAQPTFFVLIFLAPLADEIIGGLQFESLCANEALLTVDEAKAQGKTVIYQGVAKEHLNRIIPIEKHTFFYREKGTNELLINWVEFEAKGGLLSRTFNSLWSHEPFIFEGHCAPPGYWDVFKKLNMTQLDKE